MKKHWKIISLSVIIVTAIATTVFLSGYKSRSQVTVTLDKMFSDERMGLYSHTMFYEQKYPELYNEIISMGEKAIDDLLIDFVENPENDVRKNVIIDIVTQIIQKDELSINKSIKENALQDSFTSSSEWFDQIGKELYIKYVGKIDESVMKSVNFNKEVDTMESHKSDEGHRTILRGKEFEFELGTNIPEPKDAIPPDDDVKWEPRLGCYVVDNIYYDEVNNYFYMID